MKTPRLTLLAFLALGACQAPLAPAIPLAGAAAVVPGEIVLRYWPGTTEADKAALRRTHAPAGVLGVLPDGERWRLESPAAAERTLAALAAEPRLRYAEPNHFRTLALPPAEGPEGRYRTLQLSGQPNDAEVGKQWHLARSRFQAVWPRTTGVGVTVAVIDSGVDPEHPDLEANLLPLVDEVALSGKSDTFNGQSYAGRDANGHGTHVAGILGAVANNTIGVAGGAPGVKILPIKVAFANGDTDDALIAKGLRDAVDKGVQVINLSIGGPPPSQLLLDALNYAFERGVPVVTAAGNDGGPLNYPAAYAGAIAVGAITPKNAIASYSSSGKNMAIAAPGGGYAGRNEGEAIFSTLPTYACYVTQAERKPNNYGYLAGTSMATPLVSAAAALILAQEPGLSPAQIRTRLAAAADDAGEPGFDERYGYGVLNVERAFSMTRDDGGTK